MPHMRMFLAALACAMTMSAEAGLVYRYTEGRSGGRVWIDGDRRRVERDPAPENPRTYDVAITKGGKTTFLNLQTKTYFEDSELPIFGYAKLAYHLPILDDRVDGKPKITYQNAGAGAPVVGRETTKHVIQLRYRLRAEVEGTPLRGDIDATFTVSTAAGLPGGNYPKTPQTGFPQVDEELARLFAPIEGMVMRYERSLNRTLEGGPVVNSTLVFAIEELKEADVDPSLFTIPKGLTYQEPVFGFPGGN